MLMWGHSSGVERALRMREVWGSIPHASKDLLPVAQEITRLMTPSTLMVEDYSYM